MLPMTVALSSSGGVAIRYVHPVYGIMDDRRRRVCGCIRACRYRCIWRVTPLQTNAAARC